MELKRSDYQEQIRSFFISHPHENMAVEALAGCGKTSTALMLTETTHTSDVYVAFNKSIQMEMKERLNNPKTKCYTMHSLGFSVMNYNLGLVHQKAIVDNYKVNRYIDTLYRNAIKEHHDERMPSKDYLMDNYIALYNLLRLKCYALNEEKIAEMISEMDLFGGDKDGRDHDPDTIVDWILYIDDSSKKDFEENKVCDFTDMLYITYCKLQNEEWEVPYWLYFTNIYADEAQDLSFIQLQLLKFFKRKNGRYIFIYDQHQAIYGFAGSDCKAYQRIYQLFKPLTKFSLPINYRCDKEILKYTNQLYSVGIIHGPAAQEGKVLHIPYDDIMKCAKPDDFIIGRVNSQLMTLALKLAKNNKPVYIEDKDIVQSLIKYIKSLKQETIGDLEKYYKNLDNNPMDSSQAKFRIQHLEDEGNTKDLMMAYKKVSRDQSIESFIKHINKVLNTTDSVGCIRIMSIHKSKGLEASNVFVLNEATPFVGLARNADMTQQEYNLSYVAITRAKHNLYLVKADKAESAKGEDEECEME